MYFFPSTFTFSMTPTKVADPHEQLKSSIRIAAHQLRDETVQFIEQQVEVAHRQVTNSPLHQDPPRLPIFYIKGFNLLKQLCRVIGNDYKCPILELVPWAVETCWLSEIGKKHQMPRLVKMDNGCLRHENQETLEDVDDLIDQFFLDTEEYFFNFISINGACPEIPTFVNLMRNYFKKRFPSRLPFFEQLGQKLNAHMTSTFTDEYIPADYFQTNGCL